MSSSRPTLERIGTRVPVPQPAFDRLMRRRDRRVRNRRIGSAALALLLAALAIGGAFHVLDGAERHLPASPGITGSNVKDLQLAWSASLNGLPSDIHAPSLDLDKVYPPTLADGMVFVGTDAGTLYAFDETCGTGGAACEPTWIAHVGASISDPPTVVSGIVYVSTNGGGLFAFDERCAENVTATCHPIWVARTSRAIASPVVADGRVFGIDAVNGTVYAFGARVNGNCRLRLIPLPPICYPRWTAKIEPSRANASTLKWVDFRPVVVDGVVYALGKGADDRLYAFDAQHGHLLWFGNSATPVENTISPNDTPVVADDLVLVPFGNTVQAFPVGCRTDGGQCDPTWIYDGSPPVVDGTTVVSKTFSSLSTGQVSAYGLHCGTGGTTCEPLWTVRSGGWGDDPVVADRLIVSIAYHGDTLDTYALDCGADGPCNVSWKATLTEPRTPVVSNGVVFVPTGDDHLFAYAADCGTSGATCDPVWTAPILSGQPSPPVIDDTRLFVATLDGGLYAFALPATSAPVPKESGSDRGTLFAYLGLVLAIAVVLVVRRRRAN